MTTFRIESTAQCPRTPVLLLALAEAGIAYEIEVRPDGWFEQNHGEAGPRFEADGDTKIGLSALLECVRRLPELKPRNTEDAARVDAWPRLDEARDPLTTTTT